MPTRLSTLDSSFLEVESQSAHMHVGTDPTDTSGIGTPLVDCGPRARRNPQPKTYPQPAAGVPATSTTSQPLVHTV